MHWSLSTVKIVLLFGSEKKESWVIAVHHSTTKNTNRFCCLVSLVRRQWVKHLQNSNKFCCSYFKKAVCWFISWIQHILPDRIPLELSFFYSRLSCAFLLRSLNLWDNQSWRLPFKASSLTYWLHPGVLFFDLAAEEERNCLASIWPSCYSSRHIETPVLIYCVWVVGSGWIPAHSFLHMHCQENTRSQHSSAFNTHTTAHTQKHTHIRPNKQQEYIFVCP